MAGFKKIFPNFPPITPIVTGTQSMSMYELVSILCDRYNEIAELLKNISPEEYEAAKEAAEAARTAAEVARAAAETASTQASAAAATVEEFRPQVAKAVADSASAASDSSAAVSTANAAETKAQTAKEKAEAAESHLGEAQQAAAQAEESAQAAATNAAAAVAAVDGKMDKSGGTFTGPVSFNDDVTAAPGASVHFPTLTALNLSATTATINEGTVSTFLTTRDLAVNRSAMIRNSNTPAVNVLVTVGAGEGSGDGYNGVVELAASGSGVGESGKRVALRGVIATGDSDALAKGQTSAIMDAVEEAKDAAQAAADSVEGKLDKAGGTIEGTITIKGDAIIQGATRASELSARKIEIAGGTINTPSISVDNAINIGTTVGGATIRAIQGAPGSGNVVTLTNRGPTSALPVAIRNVASQDEGDAVSRREVSEMIGG